jgi:Ca2+-binding EF-hand superfamily protein
LRWAFNFFDADGCGTITREHFKHALKIPDDQFDESYWANLIAQVDEDKDGCINF